MNLYKLLEFRDTIVAASKSGDQTTVDVKFNELFNFVAANYRPLFPSEFDECHALMNQPKEHSFNYAEITESLHPVAIVREILGKNTVRCNLLDINAWREFHRYFGEGVLLKAKVTA